MIDRLFSYIYWRILIWILEVTLQLSLAVLRSILPLLLELMEIVGRIIVRLLSYPECWVLIAVVTLWTLTDHGMIASSVALLAITSVFIGALVRARTL
jgi:hypothetical protein